MLAMVASYMFAATRGKTRQRERQIRERERKGGEGKEREKEGGEGFYVLDTDKFTCFDLKLVVFSCLAERTSLEFPPPHPSPSFPLLLA